METAEALVLPRGLSIRHRNVEQSLAADGAIASFSSNFILSAWTLIARRS
jgi:hypothetical protein